MIITLIGADFSKSNIGTLSSWIISRVLGDGATYAGPSYVDKDAALSATVTLDEGYEVGSAGITITMGGTALDESCYSVVDNVITFTIASVTGSVVIKVPTLNTNTGEEDGGNEEGGTGETTPINLTLYKSAAGNTVLDYKDVWKMFGADSLGTLGSQIIGVDVSAYVGQTITITAAQSVIAGANYSMFCSNLPNSYIKSLGELDGYNSFGTATNYEAESYDNLIESFNISTIAETTNTITKVVPTNAKYLFFANLSTKCSNPLVVVGNTAEASLVSYVTEDGWCCMDYQTYFYLTANSTFKSYQSKVIAIDVSELVGKTLSITATQSVVDGAYYAFFTNKLPTGIDSIEQIEGLVYSDTGKYNFVDKASDLVGESFNVSTEHQVTNTITKVVPTGAKYLFVNTLNKFGSNYIKLI